MGRYPRCLNTGVVNAIIRKEGNTEIDLIAGYKGSTHYKILCLNNIRIFPGKFSTAIKYSPATQKDYIPYLDNKDFCFGGVLQ